MKEQMKVKLSSSLYMLYQLRSISSNCLSFYKVREPQGFRVWNYTSTPSLFFHLHFNKWPNRDLFCHKTITTTTAKENPLVQNFRLPGHHRHSQPRCQKTQVSTWPLSFISNSHDSYTLVSFTLGKQQTVLIIVSFLLQNPILEQLHTV